MKHYKELSKKCILDRTDLKYSPYIAALNIEYSHDLPFFWSFAFDSSPESVCYGRNFNDLICFFELLKKEFGFSSEHKLIIIVDDLSIFFGYTKKILPYDSEPFVAKSHYEILLAQCFETFEIHCYKQFYETNVKEDMILDGLIVPTLEDNSFSDICTIPEQISEYCADKVEYICAKFRQELDNRYQGITKNLSLTKTTAIERVINAEMRKADNKAECNIKKQIMKMNPIISAEGREKIFPLLYKAFFGGISFLNDEFINTSIDCVYSADITSAYVHEMITSKYPISRFEQLQLPKNPTDLLNRYYSRYAMIIVLEAANVELRPGAMPFLPSALRHGFINTNDLEECKDVTQRCSATRIKSAKYIRIVLTDIDFRLFLQHYKSDIRLRLILGSRYGYLPDYITKTIAIMYQSKRIAKNKYERLERAGIATESDKIEYKRKKSELARLYGIFTRSPVVRKYSFDPETKDAVVTEENHIPKSRFSSAVLYQWGVWTTALVRRRLSTIYTGLLNNKAIILSGDTDCINFKGNCLDIINQYNKAVSIALELREKQLGYAPGTFQGLGQLTLKKFNQFKYTGLKQYCYIHNTNKGEKFEYKVGGLSLDCKYFSQVCKSNSEAFAHFGLGLTIPARYAPRRFRQNIDSPTQSYYEDINGNIINAVVPSCIQMFATSFTFDSSVFNYSNSLARKGEHLDVEHLRDLSKKSTLSGYNFKIK